MMEVPKALTYASVISTETVQIALNIAALNDLEVKMADIQNVFLAATCYDSIHAILGPEFGEYQGKRAVIVHVLYGRLSSGRSS